MVRVDRSNKAKYVINNLPPETMKSRSILLTSSLLLAIKGQGNRKLCIVKIYIFSTYKFIETDLSLFVMYLLCIHSFLVIRSLLSWIYLHLNLKWIKVSRFIYSRFYDNTLSINSEKFILNDFFFSFTGLQLHVFKSWRYKQWTQKQQSETKIFRDLHRSWLLRPRKRKNTIFHFILKR